MCAANEKIILDETTIDLYLPVELSIIQLFIGTNTIIIIIIIII